MFVVKFTLATDILKNLVFKKSFFGKSIGYDG